MNRRGLKGALYLKTLQDVKILRDMHRDPTRPRSKSWDIIQAALRVLMRHEGAIYRPYPIGGVLLQSASDIEWARLELLMRRDLAAFDPKQLGVIRARGSFSAREQEISKRLAAAAKDAWITLVSVFPLAAAEARWGKQVPPRNDRNAHPH